LKDPVFQADRLLSRNAKLESNREEDDPDFGRSGEAGEGNLFVFRLFDFRVPGYRVGLR